MPWKLAVDIAKAVEDVTYEEWCKLFVSAYDPTPEQIEVASQTAHTILVRNQMIKESVVFEPTPGR